MQWCCVESEGWAVIFCKVTTPVFRGSKLFSLQQRNGRYLVHRRKVISRSQTSSNPRWTPGTREPFHFWNYCEICGEYGTSSSTMTSLHLTACKCDAAPLVRLSHWIHGAGNGDGILICDACQGQGIVATKVGVEEHTSRFNPEVRSRAVHL